MKILITGIAGFVGSNLAREIRNKRPDVSIIGLDNFIRPGSENNRHELKALGIKIFHGDLRNRSDLETLPSVDWVIDAAANPSVLAGVDGKTSSLQLIEHNLGGTIQLLEYCKTNQAGFILLSTSRVYSIPGISSIQVESKANAFSPLENQEFPEGISRYGVAENFSTMAPVSLYGASKVASETLALEYGSTFGFPVWINRCGVLAGRGQFGRPDQGIFSYWINAYLGKQPLKYIGFGGKGNQVRDCLHPKDLVPLILKQMVSDSESYEQICNFSGGVENSMSLAQLSDWCKAQCGTHKIGSDPAMRAFDIPWMVLDNRKAKQVWDWEPKTPINDILKEILDHAKEHPDWLELSTP
jgi:CDP-paratose 2-epimerase